MRVRNVRSRLEAAPIRNRLPVPDRRGPAALRQTEVEAVAAEVTPEGPLLELAQAVPWVARAGWVPETAMLPGLVRTLELQRAQEVGRCANLQVPGRGKGAFAEQAEYPRLPRGNAVPEAALGAE